MSTLFDRIDTCRKLQNLSLYAIEKGSHLTNGTIRNWKHSMPAGDKILSVANFLDVSVDYLLGNTENPKSHKYNSMLNTALSHDLYKVVTDLDHLSIDTVNAKNEIIRILNTSGILAPQRDKENGDES